MGVPQNHQFIHGFSIITIHFVVLLPSFIETSKWGEENVPQQIAVGQRMIEMEDVSTCLNHQIGYHLPILSIYTCIIYT